MSCISSNHSNELFDFKKNHFILGITSNGGGGHQKAMEAIQAIFNKDVVSPQKKFKVVDVLKGSFPWPLGNIIVKCVGNSWNKAKKSGNIKKQEFLVTGKCLTKKGPSNQRLADLIFFIPIFVATFFRLMFSKKTLVVDTQPIGTKAIIKAIRLVNFIFRRKIKYIKVITDLPTSECTHFSAPLKSLSDKDKKILKIMTTGPLIENEKTEVKWWKDIFGLNYTPKIPETNNVVYAPFPLRPAFQNSLTKTNQIQIKINNEEEFDFIKAATNENLIKHQSEEGKNTKEHVSIPIKESDYIGFVTLGSQVSNKTKDYGSSLLEMAIEMSHHAYNAHRKFYFFFACGEHKPKRNDLCKQVFELTAKIPLHLKKQIHLIPMGFQSDREIASLMHRANTGIYGTGGLTSMEVLNSATGNIFLHSEICKVNETTLEEAQKKLLNGIALWEKGNTRYILKEKNAKISIPGPLFKNFLLSQHTKVGA